MDITSIGQASRPNGPGIERLRHGGTTSTMAFVRWAEARLYETVGLSVMTARLYGLEILDPAAFDDRGANEPGALDTMCCAARMSFVGEHIDASELVLGAAALVADRFDGLVLASTRWHSVGGADGTRPGVAERSRRARVTVSVGDAGAAIAVRLVHRPGEVTVLDGLASGGASGLRLAAVWAGHRRG